MITTDLQLRRREKPTYPEKANPLDLVLWKNTNRETNIRKGTIKNKGIYQDSCLFQCLSFPCLV